MEDLTVNGIISMWIKLFALMTPPGVLSAFISATYDVDSYTKNFMAFKTSLAIFIIGAFLFIFGPSIFGIFGFTLGAFRIGVGILLFLTAIELMNDDGQNHHHHAIEGDISVVPLAIPLGMGPSAIGTVIVIGAATEGMRATVTGLFSLFLASFAMFFMLCMADVIAKALGKTGIVVMAKLTALLLSAIAAQVIFTGIKAFI